jgi:nucleotide-binding universal stress UspA family protein
MKRFSNILLMADAALANSIALKRAVALALNNQASLTLVDSVDSIPTEMQMAVTAITPAEVVDIVVSEKRAQLEQVVTCTAKSGVDIKTNVLVGKPFLEVIRQVLRNKHDLVIKCVEPSTTLKDVLFGSTDMHLMRKCPCPVWIIKPTEHQHYRRILAAVDQDPEDTVKDILNRQILEMSTSMALTEFSELHIVHAWHLITENIFRSDRTDVTDAEVDAMVAEEANKRKQWLENLVNTYGNKRDKDAVDYLEPQLHLIKGDAKHIVPTIARELNVDLIIMGTIARTGIPGFFMGNTAESILNQIDCSVLTIKPPGFVSPVSL